MASFTFERQVASPPQTVFDVVTDYRRYTEFTPMRHSGVEREGAPDPNGVGLIRTLGLVGPPLREEVIAYEPARRFSYKMLSGAPLRDHVGTIELTPSGGGTRLVYAIRTTPTIPLAGPLLVAVVKRTVKGLFDGISAESERLAAANA